MADRAVGRAERLVAATRELLAETGATSATVIYNLWTTQLRDLRRAGKLGQLDEINAAADHLWKLCGRILRIPTHEPSAGKGPR